MVWFSVAATPAPITAAAGRVFGVTLRGGGPKYLLPPSAPARRRPGY